jgi:hypothetical protein
MDMIMSNKVPPKAQSRSKTYIQSLLHLKSTIEDINLTLFIIILTYNGCIGGNAQKH